MKGLILVLALFTLVGCQSTAAKYAERVGCKESEATVMKEHGSAFHETYTVECKGKTFSCSETAFGEKCTKQ